MPAPLPDKARAILDDKTYVTLATVNDDGSPQASVLWATRDGDDVLLSTVVGRKKERNLRRDPRASVVAINPSNPYDYVEIRGTVSMTEDGGPELIQTLSQKYHEVPYTNDAPGTPRVVVRLTPEHVTGMGG